MNQKPYCRALLLLILFVVCLFNSQTVGNSFSLQGKPSGIVRLKITKSIKSVKNNSITDQQQSQKEKMNLAISERRQGLGGSSNDCNSYLSNSKVNRYEQIVDLYRKDKNTASLNYLYISSKQVLRI